MAANLFNPMITAAVRAAAPACPDGKGQTGTLGDGNAFTRGCMR
jgi:hypothetical protein